MEIKDLAGLSGPLTRLIEVVSDGIGAVCKPYLTRKAADAHAYKIRAISPAVNEVAKKHQLPVVYKDPEVEIWQKPDDKTLVLEEKSIDDRISLRLDYQERKRQRNIENITSIAATELANDNYVPEERPDEDWVNRFFAYSQDVSSDQMHHLWGRILAGEIKKPGTYSLRTLELIRNLTKKDAERFERVGKFSLESRDRFFVHNHKWLKNKIGILYGDLIALGEIGAMYQTPLQLPLFGDESIQEEELIAGESLVIFRRGEINNVMQLPIWKYTVIGRELLNLIPHNDDEEYLEQLARVCVDHGGNAAIAKIVQRLPNGEIRYHIVREITKE